MLVSSGSHIYLSNLVTSPSSSVNIQHHCRHCGNIFCAECSSRNALTPSSKKPVRVCETCFEELQAWFPSFILNLPQNTPSPNSYPFLLQQAEEGVSLSYFNVHYRGQTQCKDSHLHVTPGSGVEETHWWIWMKRHQSHVKGIWWDWLGLSVSVFVPLLLLWTARKWRQWELNTIHLFEVHIHIAILVFFAIVRWLLCMLKNVWHQKVEGQWNTARSDCGSRYCSNDVVNHCCPTKIYTGNYFVQENLITNANEKFWKKVNH